VDNFVSNNGFGLAADVADNAAAIAALQMVSVARFEDCGDGTVADHKTGLLWERKTGTPSGSFFPPGVFCHQEADGCLDPHFVGNRYSLEVPDISAGPSRPAGNVYLDFLARLNGLEEERLDTNSSTSCFAFHCDWRLPEVSELQAIMVGPGSTISGQQGFCRKAEIGLSCIDQEFTDVGGHMNTSQYVSATRIPACHAPPCSPAQRLWAVGLASGIVNTVTVNTGQFGRGASARAVRSGSCGS
jgi:hypothetical protein